MSARVVRVATVSGALRRDQLRSHAWTCNIEVFWIRYGHAHTLHALSHASHRDDCGLFIFFLLDKTDKKDFVEFQNLYLKRARCAEEKVYDEK